MGKFSEAVNPVSSILEWGFVEFALFFLEKFTIIFLYKLEFIIWDKELKPGMLCLY